MVGVTVHKKTYPLYPNYSLNIWIRRVGISLSLLIKNDKGRYLTTAHLFISIEML